VDNEIIGRVLQNLLGNAIKFTPPGGKIEMTARPPETTASTLLWVAVSNSGPGIPPEIQDRLFQKFVTGRQEESGSGLGLAFCRLAVEAHGGRIWVESEPGQLTTFQFTLPIRRNQELR
jgi:signal transduction histidine kinase